MIRLDLAVNRPLLDVTATTEIGRGEGKIVKIEETRMITAVVTGRSIPGVIGMTETGTIPTVTEIVMTTVDTAKTVTPRRIPDAGAMTGGATNGWPPEEGTVNEKAPRDGTGGNLRMTGTVSMTATAALSVHQDGTDVVVEVWMNQERTDGRERRRRSLLGWRPTCPLPPAMVS